MNLALGNPNLRAYKKTIIIDQIKNLFYFDFFLHVSKEKTLVLLEEFHLIFPKSLNPLTAAEVTD